MLLQERLFNTREFNQLATTIFSPGERVELLEGKIVNMSPIGSRHLTCVNELNEWLILNLSRFATISVQNSVELSDASEPQPDIAILKGRPNLYRNQIPTTQDIFLLIEVADTSEEFDREVKIPLYAREGVVEVWIVSLANRVVDVFRNPQQGAYQTVVRYTFADAVPLPLGEGLSIPVSVFIGPA